jgi:hypothetical protein
MKTVVGIGLMKKVWLRNNWISLYLPTGMLELINFGQCKEVHNLWIYTGSQLVCSSIVAKNNDENKGQQW